MAKVCCAEELGKKYSWLKLSSDVRASVENPTHVLCAAQGLSVADHSIESMLYELNIAPSAAQPVEGANQSATGCSNAHISEGQRGQGQSHESSSEERCEG